MYEGLGIMNNTSSPSPVVETLSEEQPRRIWLRPMTPWRSLSNLYSSKDVAAERVNEDSVEYVRADIVAALRETLKALKNCRNKPVCGHCNALLRAATKEL